MSLRRSAVPLDFFSSLYTVEKKAVGHCTDKKNTRFVPPGSTSSAQFPIVRCYGPTLANACLFCLYARTDATNHGDRQSLRSTTIFPTLNGRVHPLQRRFVSRRVMQIRRVSTWILVVTTRKRTTSGEEEAANPLRRIITRGKFTTFCLALPSLWRGGKSSDQAVMPVVDI